MHAIGRKHKISRITETHKNRLSNFYAIGNTKKSHVE